MKTTKQLILTLTLALFATFAFSQDFTSILMTNTGTAHNFTDGTGGSAGVGYTFALSQNVGDGNGVCIVCHTPHNAVSTDLPLWDHELAGAGFTIYSSPTNTLDGTITQPGSASQLCLGCHDGTANLDAYGSSDNPTGSISMQVLDAYADFGLILSDDHPITITYPAAADFAAEQMVNPATLVTAGGFLYGTGDGTMTVECASCHSLHNPAVINRLLRVSNDNSALCLTCHAK